MCEKQVISTFTVAEMAKFCVFPLIKICEKFDFL